jgi:hypothetical protein
VGHSIDDVESLVSGSVIADHDVTGYANLSQYRGERIANPNFLIERGEKYRDERGFLSHNDIDMHVSRECSYLQTADAARAGRHTVKP